MPSGGSAASTKSGNAPTSGMTSAKPARSCKSAGGAAGDGKKRTASIAGTPSLYVCGYCDRDGETINPLMQRHPTKAYLMFANESQCMSCRNMCNKRCKGTPAKEIRASLKSPPIKDDWKQKVFKLEEQFDKGKVPATDDGDELTPILVQGKESLSKESTKLLHNWWPQSALVREEVKFEESELEPHEGESELGLFRDAKYTPCSGCIIGTTKRAKTLEQTTTLSCSLDDVGKTDSMDMMKKLLASAGEARVDVSEAGVVNVVSLGAGGTSVDKDQDGWDDILPSFA